MTTNQYLKIAAGLACFAIASFFIYGLRLALNSSTGDPTGLFALFSIAFPILGGWLMLSGFGLIRK